MLTQNFAIERLLFGGDVGSIEFRHYIDWRCNWYSIEDKVRLVVILLAIEAAVMGNLIDRLPTGMD